MKAAWTPALVSNVALWFDASRLAGNDGDAIGTLPNLAKLTGSAANATQANGALKPILKKGANGLNGRSVLRFNGTTQFMAGSFPVTTTTLHFFFMARLGAAVATDQILFGSNGTGSNPTPSIRWGVSCGSASSGDGNGWGGTTGSVVLGATVRGAANQVFYGRFTKPAAGPWVIKGVNDLTSGPDATFPTGGAFNFIIGMENDAGGYPWAGDLGEFLVVDGPLTANQINAIECYLSNKWSPPTVNAPPVRIMAGIDSITMGSHGAPTTEPQWSGGYRTAVFNRLIQAPYNKTNFLFVGTQYIDSFGYTLPTRQCFHEGHSGFSFVDPITPPFDWSAHLAGYLALTGVPDIFLLEGGTNEFSNGFTGAQALTHLATCLGIIFALAPAAIVLVSDVVASPVYAVQAAAFNAGLGAVIAAAVLAGQDVRWTGAQAGVTFAPDGVHPNAAGYDTMGANMVAAVAAALP